MLTFQEYFDKITSHITEPYGTSQMKLDHDDESEEPDEGHVGNKRKRTIVFENPLKDEEFLERIDFSKLTIKKDGATEQPSAIFTDEFVTILKSQIHIYKTFIVNNVPVRQDLFDSLMVYTNDNLIKSEPVDITEPSFKKCKIDESGEIHFLESRSFTNYERVPISFELLELGKKEELNNLHITEYQNLIFKKYAAITGLFMPDYFNIEKAPFNPESLHESIFVQVVHAKNHWVVVSNYNPSYKDPDGLNNWFIYDSLNNPTHYLNQIKHVLKRICGESRFIDIIHVHVSKQIGNKDCGLFALGYPLSLAMCVDPGKLIFDQKKIREEFNDIMDNKNLFLFSNSEIDNYSPKFTKICVDLN